MSRGTAVAWAPIVAGATAPLARQANAPAYAVANEMLAAKGRSFHWARHLLNNVHADRATRLYGFCRRVDDLADETNATGTAHEALFALDRAFETGASPDPLTADALRLMAECRIDPAIPRLLIEGVSGDLQTVGVVDVPALLRYCYKVAGTVGLMMSAALDTRDLVAAPHAIDLGIAMQLTNLCRDVADDAQVGRRYLPASLISSMAPARLVNPAGADRVLAQSVVLRLLDLADNYYASGEDGLHYLPSRAGQAILVAARVYQAIGTRLRQRRGDAWSGRVLVRAPAKAAITARALLSPSRARRPHDQSLHTALAGYPGIHEVTHV
jgi:phytoene synthase